jgi:hypothetical protein
VKPVRVEVNDLMQEGYVYYRTEPVGENLHPDFRPELTPKEMLELGVFGGRYMTDCGDEFPEDWFENAKLCSLRHDPKLNYFGVNASQPLAVWRAKGWIHELVPMVLPLLPGPPLGRRRAADQALAGRPAPRRADHEELPPRRPRLPPQATPGPAALGV